MLGHPPGNAQPDSGAPAPKCSRSLLFLHFRFLDQGLFCRWWRCGGGGGGAHWRSVFPGERSGSRNPEGGPFSPAPLTASACHICKYVRLTQAASPCNASLCFCRNIYTSADLVQTNAFSALSKAHRERSRIYTGISCAFVFAPCPFLELIFWKIKTQRQTESERGGRGEWGNNGGGQVPSGEAHVTAPARASWFLLTLPMVRWQTQPLASLWLEAETHGPPRTWWLLVPGLGQAPRVGSAQQPHAGLALNTRKL